MPDVLPCLSKPYMERDNNVSVTGHIGVVRNMEDQQNQQNPPPKPEQEPEPAPGPEQKVQTLPTVKAYCNKSILRHLIHAFSIHSGIDKNEKHTLLKLFSSSRTSQSTVNGRSHTICFCFWGFFKNEEMRVQLVKILQCALHPKVYMVGETRKNFLEGFILVRTDRLGTTCWQFEEWLNIFFSNLRMSAGTNIFTEYMEDQMLTSMERIRDNSINIWSNIYVDANQDFLLLFQTKLKLKKEAEFVMRTTGVSFTAQEFVNVFQRRSAGRLGMPGTRRGITGINGHFIGSGFNPFLSNLSEMEEGALRNFVEMEEGALQNFVEMEERALRNFSESEQRALRAESEQRARRAESEQRARRDVMQSVGEHNYTILVRHTH